MPILLERAAQLYVRERDMRAVLDAWRSFLLLPGRVERRWKTWVAFNGHLLRACIRFWHMPWDEDTRAAFDAWRSYLFLSKSLDYHRFLLCLAARQLLVACIRAWKRDRDHEPRVPPAYLRRWCNEFGVRRVVNPWVVNPNEIASFILGVGTTGIVQVCDTTPHRLVASRYLGSERVHVAMSTRQAVVDAHESVVNLFGNVPVTDWYAPHQSEIAMSMGLERTISTALVIGGGTAGVVAMSDEIPHHYLASGYRELYTRHAVVNRGDADRHDAGS